MIIDQDFSACSDQGKRDYQEDYYGFADPEGNDEIDLSGQRGLLLILADGMGGHVGGAIASKTVVDTFITRFIASAGQIPERLKEALHGANDKLGLDVMNTPSLKGMGSTLVAALVHGHQLHWVSVGDSPLYLYRGGSLHQINADHSMAPQIDAMAARGEISAEDAKNHPNRNALVSVVMGRKLSIIDLPETPLELAPDDWVIIASDGLQTLSNEEIAECVTQNKKNGAEVIAQSLLERTLAKGDPYQDNVTIMVTRFGKPLAKRPSIITTKMLPTQAVGREPPGKRPRQGFLWGALVLCLLLLLSGGAFLATKGVWQFSTIKEMIFGEASTVIAPETEGASAPVEAGEASQTLPGAESDPSRETAPETGTGSGTLSAPGTVEDDSQPISTREEETPATSLPLSNGSGTTNVQTPPQEGNNP